MSGPLFQVDFLSAPEVKKALQSYRKVTRPAIAAAMYQLGCAIISDSIPLAPKDTGTLRNSGYCALPQVSGDGVVVEGGYGGFAKDYALVQHENMTYRHTEGGPKYLERAYNLHAPGAAEYVAQVLSDALRTGTAPPAAGRGVPTSPDNGGGNKRTTKKRPASGSQRKGRRRAGRKK